MSKLLKIIEGPRVAGDHLTMLQIALNSEQERATLFKYTLQGNLYQRQRCSHVLIHVARKKPTYFDLAVIENIITYLINDNDNASVARNLMCVIKDLKMIPESQESPLFDYCLSQISKYSNPPAVIAFAADIAIQIASEYKELLLELEQVLKVHEEREAASIKIQLRKIEKLKASS